jgi:hypothetical protein
MAQRNEKKSNASLTYQQDPMSSRSCFQCGIEKGNSTLHLVSERHAPCGIFYFVLHSHQCI